MTISVDPLRRPISALAALCAASSIVLLPGCVDSPPSIPLVSRDPPSGQGLTPRRHDQLSELLDRSEGRASAAIIDVEPSLVFEHKGHERYELASVAKIYILTAYLNKLAHEARGPSPEEFELMRAMIEYSDNDSATELFHAVGDADGINAFLESRHNSPIEPAHDGSWGSMRASPIDVGEFLARLHSGEMLDVSQTALSFALLGNIIEEQAWGVGSARDGSGVNEVYLKNGWLPGDEGWIVNSVGLLKSADRTYIVIFMSDRQPTFEQAVQDIESAVGIIRTSLFDPTPGPAGTATPTLAPTPTVEPARTPPATPIASPEPMAQQSTRTPLPEETPTIRSGSLPGDSFGP